eukprot:scaffold1130_cov127-Isochrysis_galbana.AAC.14
MTRRGLAAPSISQDRRANAATHTLGECITLVADSMHVDDEGLEEEADAEKGGLDDGVQAPRRAHHAGHRALGQESGGRVGGCAAAQSHQHGLALVRPDLAYLPPLVPGHVGLPAVVGEGDAGHATQQRH